MDDDGERHAFTLDQLINEQLLSLSAWRDLFEGNGLEIIRVLPDRGHAVKWRVTRGGTPSRFILGPPAEVAWRLIPLRWQYQLVFVLRRRSTAPIARQSPAS